jgi:peptide deformylase
MSVRTLLSYPDARLQAMAEPVIIFDAELSNLVSDLTDTMRAAPGIGITGSHIGVLKRVVVLELNPGDVRVYINPEILWSSEETMRHQEGSVSMSGGVDEIERPARIRIRYQGVDGAEHEEESDGLHAICHQHEIDQLNGIFWIQRLSRLKRDRIIKRYNKLRR